MAVTAGVSTVEKVSSDIVKISATAATTVTGTAVYQWHRSVVDGFTPSAATALAGQTELTLDDEFVLPNTTFYYVLVVSDDEPSSANYTQVEAAVGERASSPNQFDQRVVAGQSGLLSSDLVVSAVVDADYAGVLREGDAVKLSTNSGEGIPKVELADGATDQVFGYVVYANKQAEYQPEEKLEIVQRGCRYLYAGEAIAAGERVVLNDAFRGTVLKANSTGNRIVGYAYDKATNVGELFRVMIDVPSFELDS